MNACLMMVPLQVCNLRPVRLFCSFKVTSQAKDEHILTHLIG